MIFLSDENGVSIGLPLNETKLFIKTEDENSLIDLNEVLLNETYSDKVLEGKLLHSSATRVCYLDGQRVDLIESGDKCLVKNKKVYLKGRSDRFVKINAKMLNLTLLEKVNKFKII